MMENEQESRRQFPRIGAVHSMLIEPLEEGAGGEFATSRSMSLGGLGFVSDESFNEGQIVKVMITVGSKVIAAKARVAYQQKLDDDRMETGLAFVELGAADRAVLEDLIDKGQ
jgi:hypothetical protein